MQALISLGDTDSLHSLVIRAETLLSQAARTCNRLWSERNKCGGSSSLCPSLLQLHQALQDGAEFLQREYEHVGNSCGSQEASVGDQIARIEFGLLCSVIDEQIAKPLENIEQRLLHQHDQQHHHTVHHGGGHCWSWSSFFVEEHHHHHHNHHNHNHHHRLTEYEIKFQVVLVKWGEVKGCISSYFDQLEGRLKKNKKKNGGGGNKDDDDDKDNRKKTSSVSDAAQKYIDAVTLVENEVHVIAKTDEQIHTMGRLRTRSNSFSSSCSD
ncbi:hypothetical protein QBC47DRAFT_378603 [Echria macrotheca]|uniref:Uncharacterized protein n=1 Tax=Echria macrotheca TaxID=438768 RepID=A0AAJ0BFT2_9PEZI|nr:hypothetical protein QBC47DRAFT_378603 [Echria macrotheca]